MAVGIIVWAVCLPSGAAAQSVRTYRVFFRDKGISPFVPGSALYRATEAIITPKARLRRTKVLPSDSAIMFSDAPIYEPYLEDIRRSGARVLLRLRWRNYAVVECDSATAAVLSAKPYVSSVIPTSSVLRPQSAQRSLLDAEVTDLYRYGPSQDQLQMLHIPELHQLGITGSDVVIGFIDTGFRWREHRALASARVLAEYDFIGGDTVTANQEGDPSAQDGHGTAVMSVIAGVYPDSLVGAAPCAGFLLAKTENIASERRIEEDAYAAAVEWMEALGVDVINTSLGYSVFDSTEAQYDHADLNGRTTIVSCAVNAATERGVVCVVAAGNEGDSPETISSPGDSDSALTVGAFANTAFDIPRFTSRGPTVDGRLKPNLAALGVNVRTASNANPLAFGYSSGTSLATPLVTGAVALLLQAHPDLTPWQIRELLQTHASHSTQPNTAIGYGAPNAMQAAKQWNIVCSPPIVITRGDSVLIAIAAESNYQMSNVMVTIRSSRDTIEYPLSKQGSLYSTVIPMYGDSIELYYFLRDQQRSRRYPPFGSIAFRRGDTLLPCGWTTTNLLTHVPISYAPATLPNVQGLALPLDGATLPIPARPVTAYCTIYDLTLRAVATELVPPMISSLALPNLDRGTYLVRLDYNDGESFSQLVLVY